MMRSKRAAVIFLIPLCLFFGARAALAQTSSIPWNQSLTVSRTSSDEDIKTVLRSLLQANGTSVIFTPEVQGPISFRLNKVPIAAAFDQLIQEHNLAYGYNPATNTVNVTTLAADSQRVKSGSFVPLDAVSYDELLRAMMNFGLSAQNLKYDAGTRTVALSGDAEHVQQIADLIKTLETAHQRQKERQGADRTRELQLKRAELAQQAFEELKHFQVKVIPLRFTDVGPTTKQFQGRTVTIPGIADTLTSILGIAPPSPGAQPPPATAPGMLPPDSSLTDMPGESDNTLLGEAKQLGHPRLSIDQRTNSVVVQGTAEAIASVEKLVHDLDRPLQMVQIEVTIAQADLGVARQLGIDWRSSALSPGGTPFSGAIDTGTAPPQIGNNSTGTGFSTTGLDALSLLPIAGTAGQTTASFVVKGAEGALQAQLQALASKDRARILSAPRLITLDNITARITRSQNIFVQVDTRGATGGGLGGVGLQEIQTGLTLEITPSIVPAETDRNEALVRLNLRAENSSPGAGVFGQIDVKSQEVQTNVLVPDGATFVIGGLFDDSQIVNESGVPGLKDIPLIGSLFRNSTNQKTMGETIFFITPHLVDERSVLQDDIAVKVGSEDYIRRERRALTTEVHDPSNGTSSREPNLSHLEEDE
ncbi:MAG TPA: secretin N-terminal domain-containing protein [Micropepsaceae bacterium]|jgi:type II secretory pathway component GspD/PulD (secretin)